MSRSALLRECDVPEAEAVPVAAEVDSGVGQREAAVDSAPRDSAARLYTSPTPIVSAARFGSAAATAAVPLARQRLRLSRCL